jgi:DNA repair protein RAD7
MSSSLLLASNVGQTANAAFPQSHNISANRIRQDAEARRRAAEASQDAQSNQTDGTAVATANGQDNQTSSVAGPRGRVLRTASAALSSVAGRSETPAQEAKRKRDEEKAIDKIKRRKKNKKAKISSDSDDDLYEALRAPPLPGQMENCEICGKRFTVTPYSRAGPDGGLLCNPCGKELEKDAAAAKKKAKRPSGGPSGKRRNVQSRLLDGTYKLGAKSLMTLCISTLVKNIDLADELGDLGPNAIDKIARALSKRRMLDSRTLNLFLQPYTDEVRIYDAAKLTSDDLLRIFQQVPNLKHLKIKNAIQFKDEVMEYLLSRHIDLESLYLLGANLLSEEMWNKFLKEKGTSLKSFRVYFTDRYFGDSTLALLPKYCPSLKRFKIRHIQNVTGAGVKELAKVKSLEHLGLQLHHTVHPDVYVHVLNEIGPNLRTFSISIAPTADNTVLDAMHAKCRALQKLRINDSEVMTDDGFARLFTDWANPALRFVDLSKCRQVDSVKPRENPDNIGLCSNGFRALMEHSGDSLEHLNVHACRHISREAFEDVFGPEKVYPNLTELEISFCEEVNDFIVGSAFRSCPNLRKMNVFGCMKVKDVKVPRGKILVGVPNALGMVIDGDQGVV